MSLDGAKLRYVDESGLPVVVAAKGRTFQVGSYLTCDLVLDGPQVEEMLCEIKCDAFGRVTINNKSLKELVHLNDKVLHGKRPLLHGGRITILNQVYTWEFPKISETEDVPRTPERLSPVEQASNSCPSLKLQSHRPQIDKRLTVHNFRYCINSDDEGNTSIESRDESDAHVEADESLRCKTPPNADDEPAAEAGQTPKVDLLDATQNKENTATPPASHKKLLKLCALSDVVITSFSPRETGVKTEKSFTCVRKPNVATISTPKSVYSTPKSVLSELNEDSCSRDLLDFSTPSTSKKTRRKTSMYLIDLTTPQKLRPTLKHTPIIVSDSADESSGVSPLVIDITQADTPPSPAPAPSHQVAKTPKRLAAAATPKRTPQSLMKRALLTSTKKQIAANRAEATTPVAAPKRPSLLQARRQCLTTPTRLPFHPLKRTAAQQAADQEKAKTPRTSPRKRPSLFFASPRENKLSQMRQSLAGARRSPNVEMSNKLVSKARRSLSNSPRDGSPKLESPRIGSPRHGSPKPASSIAPLTPQTSGSVGKEFNISKSKCSTPEKLDDSGDNLSRTFTIKDDDDESGGEPSRAGSTVEAFASLMAGEMGSTKAIQEVIEDSLKSPKTAVATEEPPVDAVDEIPIIEDIICEEIHVDLPEKIVEGAVLIDDSICEELPTDPKANAEEASQKDQLESLETIEEDKASLVKASTVEKPAMEVEKEAPALRTPLPRRSSRRISADQRTLATTPRRSTRRASVEVNSDQNVIGQRTRRASCSAADTQALATPTRKRRLTEEMGTPTRQSKRLLNTPKRTNLVDESVGDMGVIVEEAAPADEKEKAAAEDEDYGTELATDEPDNVDYHGLRDMLKTPKSCSTPLYKGLRELMQTPKMPASPILGNIEELLERSDSVSDTPRRSRQRAPAEEPEGRDLDRILKTPSAKNIMVPNEPASAVLHSRKDYTSDSVLISCNLSVGRHTLPLDNIFHDVPSTSAVHADDSEFEINVTSVSTATDADPLAASKRNESVSSEDLMNLSAATTSRKTATTSTTYKAAIRADLNLSTLTEEGGASRDTSPSANDISGIQLLDQTSDSIFSDPLVVSVSGVESGDLTVEETKVQSVRPPSEPIPSDNRSDTDSIVGLSEPLVFSDDEETIAKKDIPHKKVEESAVTSPNKHAATDPTNTNGKDIPISVEESIEAVDSLVDEISLIEVQDITTESSINATKGNTMPNDSSMIIELDSSKDTKAPQAKETDVSSVVEATITESETYPLDSTIEYSAIELNVSSPVATKKIAAAKPGILVSEVEASSSKELPEESAAEKSEVEVESAPKELPEESITDKGTERKPGEERSPIKEAPEIAVRDIDEEEKESCEEYPAPKEKEDTPSVENSFDIIEQMPEAKETPTDVSLVEEGSEVEDILGLSAVVNAVQDTIDFEDPQTLSHETAISTDESEHKELEASSAPKPAGEQQSEASPATESASEPEKEAHSLEVNSNVVDVTQDISRAESPKEAETPPEDGAIQLDAFSILETVDQESTSIIDPPQEADVVPEKSLIEKLPEESLIEEVPEESLIKEVPEESFIKQVPEESLIKEVPEESLIEEVPEESLIKDVPEESLIKEAPEESLIEEEPEGSLIEEVPEESLIKDVPEESLIEKSPEESMIEEVPQESLIEEEPEESLIKEAPQESLIKEVPEESLIEEVPEESLIKEVPEESLIEEEPEESLIEEEPEESLIKKVLEESLVEEVLEECLIKEAPEGSLIEEMPEESLIEEVPEESLIKEVPEESLIKDVPEESLIEKSPEESMIEEVPQESLIEEEPKESLIEEVPEESLIKEVPEESLIKDVPEESLIEKSPEESMIEEVPQESLIEEEPEESLIKEAPQESLIKEVPEESLIEEVPEESLIKEAPEESLIKEVLEESLVEEVPEESLIEEALEESLVEEVPEESFIEEVPEDSLIEEIQDDAIELETTLDEIRSEDQQTNDPKVEEPSRNQKEDASPLDVPSDAEANEKPAAGGQGGITKSAIDTAKETNNLDESTAGDLAQDISLAEDEVILLDASNRLEDVSTVEEMPEPEASPAEEPADGKDKEDAIQQDAKPEDTTQNESPSEGQRSNGQDAETSASEAAEKTSPSDKSVIRKPEEAFLLKESTDMELTKEPARENGNDEQDIQLDDSNTFEDVVATSDGRKSPSDELLKAVDEELAHEAETLTSEQTSVQRKSTNDDKVIPGDALSIDQSLSGHTTEDEITADVSAVDPKATPTATAIELPKESEMKSTSETEVIPEACTTNEAAASPEDSTSEKVSEATPDEHKVEGIISTPERNIQQETETETGPEAEQRGPSPSVEAPVDVAKELSQSTPGKEEETSEIVLRSTKEPALSAPCSIAEGSVTPPPAVEPVKNPLPEKEEESAQTESSKVPVPSAPTSIVEEGTPSLAVEKALGESKELPQSSAEKETSEIIFESTKEPALSAKSSIAEESTPSPVVEVPGPEKAEIRSEHSRGSVPNAPTSSVQEEPAPLAVQEPLGELSQSSPDKGQVSVEIRSDSTKEPAPNAPICIDDESTPLSTEEIQSVSSTSESEEVVDETPTNQSIIGLNAANKPSASTGQSANDEIQIISDDSQSVSSPKEETSSQDDDEDDDEDCDEAMDMLEEQVDPVDLHVNRRETTTKVFPSKVHIDDDVIELSDSNSSHDSQEKVPTAPTVEAATEAPEAEKPSSSGAPAGVVEPKAMSVKSYTSGSAKEDEVAAATPEDTPREAALELTPAPTETTGASVSETQTLGSALDEEQDIATESERDRRNTLATEKPLESNSENGNQALEENTLKYVEEEKDAENNEKQEPEVAAEEAVKQEARKVTRLARNDGQPPAKEIQPAAKRAKKGSSVERTAEASESERPRRRGRKPSDEVQPILEEKKVITNTRRGRKPSKQSSEEAKDNEAQPKTEEILNPITDDNMPSEHVKQMDPPKRNQEESKELLPSTTKRGRGRPPSAEKDQARKAKARELLAAIKVDQTVDSEPKKLPKRGRKTPEVVQEEHTEVMPETSKRHRRAPTAEKEATKDDPHNPKTQEHLAAIKKDPPAGDEPKKTLKRARKSSELVKTEEASQQPAKEGQPDAQADRPKRGGRKPAMDVEVAAPEEPEHPRRRGQKADPTPEKESASMKPVDHHLEEIAEEIEREPEPKKLLLDDEEPKARRRGRKATAETTDVPVEHVEAASSRRRGRKATVEEGTADQLEPKSKRHSGEGPPLETPLPEIQEASTVKPTRRGRKPSVDVDTAEKKQPTRALRKPSTSVDEGTPQAKKTTARRGRKASAQAEGIDAQKNVQDVTTELAATVTATALASAEKPNDGVYPSPSHTEDELTPRRREGRNLPRKNYTEVPDDDKPSSGSRRNRKPVTSGKAAAAKTLEMEVHPTTPTPSQKGPPIEEAVRATPATPEMATVTLPDPTTSQRREGRNLPRKNYTEVPDDDKPTPSRSRRQRNPTVKALELLVDTTPRPATPRRRRGKAGTEEPHEDAPAAKKVAEETEVATVAAVKGRGTRRKAEDEAEADSAAPTKHAARAGNARKAKVETEPDSEDQPPTKKARGGARAKTPAVIISDEEPAEQPVVAVSAKKPAARGRGRAAKAAPIVEPEAMQPVPSAEAAAPSASTARSGRAKKVHFEATLPVADSATSNDEAPKRATRSRRK
ncbi:titin isoform X2 [Drosophila miranda]|uniref:titin isoform X2 n=1 Tax=Drosophila miranda TaxID=7229 RepID=UPI00143F92DD|nr:titin isoform X2 [Drosophila miranda]